MTVYSVQGTRLQTNPDGYIVDVRETHLDIITRVGTNILETFYLDPTQSSSVSLSDYNLVFDGKHLNDSVLPDQIEIFDLNAPDGSSVRVMNFVYASDTGMTEQMFSIGKAQLPEFRSPAEASAFFAKYEPANITSPDEMTIQLENIPGVQTHGVFANLEDYSLSTIYDEDSFEFFEKGSDEEVDTWQIEQEALSAQLDHIRGQLMPDGSKNLDIDPQVDDIDKLDDPGSDFTAENHDI